MADIGAHSDTSVISVSRLTNGIAGGLAGGVVFGVLMQMMDMIPMVAMLVDSKSTAVGWLVHLVISAGLGAGFAVVIGRQATEWLRAAGLGLGYGLVWWVLGALLIMPAWLGMDVFVFNKMAWQSLLGHLIYGLLLGVTFAALSRRARRG